MAKVLSCADVSPMAAVRCGFAVQTESLEECFVHLGLHSIARHDGTVEDVTPEMLSLLRSRVRTLSPAQGLARILDFAGQADGRWKVFSCSDVTAMDQCAFVVQSDTAEDIIEQAKAHARLRHGTAESMRLEGLPLADFVKVVEYLRRSEESITPEMVSLWRSRIRDLPRPERPAPA